MRPYTLDALARLCASHPTARKVVFAPSDQGGRAVADALARHGVASVGLELTTVEVHAAEYVAPGMSRPLPFFTEPVVLASLLTSETDLALRSVRLPALRRQVDALRDAGDLVPPAAPDDAADGRRTAALQALARRYGNALDGRIDAAETLRLAAREAERRGAPADTVYAAFDEAEWGPLAARFVRALTDGGRRLHRIGFDLPGLTPPPRTAAWHVWTHDDAPEPAAAGAGARLALGVAPLASDSFRFRRAVGAQAEVRDALRDILGRGLALDQVEIATTAADPYLALLHAERDLRSPRDPLPVTFAAGVPVAATRTGQFLRGLMDWLEGGRPVGTVVRLLQGGLFALGEDVGTRSQPRPLLTDADGALIGPHWAAHRLLEGGLGDGPGALAACLARAARSTERSAASGHMDAPRAAQTVDRVERLGVVFGALDALFPPVPVEPAAFAVALRTALLRFGPEGRHGTDFPGRAPGTLAPSALAHRLLARRLERFAADPPSAPPAPPAALSRAFRDAALDAYVDARAPRPGHLHVVPLSSAGLSGRPHLVVLGLDAQSAAPTAIESALLPDREAERLDASGAALPTAATATASSLWFAARALARVPPPTLESPTSVTFCQSTLDVGSGDALAPAGLLLRAAALAGHDALAACGPSGPWPLAPLVPDGRVLHDAEYDLACRGHASQTATLAARFPAAARGLAAAAARASATVTPYDGWLGPDHAGIPLLGPGAPPLSITRFEALLSCPHRHFLSTVIGAHAAPRPPEETGGLSRMDRGTLLHLVFEAYGNRLVAEGRGAHLDDLPAVIALSHAELDRWTDLHGALADEAAVRADLVRCAEVFLRSEVRFARGARPHANELPFGMDGTPVPVTLAPGVVLPLRGVIDRVDRLPDGDDGRVAFEIGDFKTGGTYSYPDEHEDPLAHGKLQWALYAYALEDVSADFPDGPYRVTRAGYRFPTPKTWGERRVWEVPERAVVAAALAPVIGLAAAGFFPPSANSGKACGFCEHTRSCGEITRRDAEVKASLSAARADAAHPLVSVLAAWTYGAPKPKPSS